MLAKRTLCVILALFPPAAKPMLYRVLFRWEIDATARIGISIIHANHVRIGKGVKIGHGNIIKHANLVEIATNVEIHHLNHFFSDWNYTLFPIRTLRIGSDVQIMSRHFFDITGEIVIGPRTVIGGRGSQFWTHSQVRDSETQQTRLEARRIELGNDCYVGAGVTVVPCSIAEGTTVAAGAVVSRGSSNPHRLIAGNPAVDKGPAN